MKNVMIFFILIITSVSYSQTKTETIEWLNRKLETYGDNYMMGSFQISIKHHNDFGEILVFTKKSWNPLLEKSTYDYYSFLPKVISKVYLSGKSRTNQTLDIFIASKSNNIYYSNKDKMILEIGIHMRNGHNKTTKRIRKGLIHLLNLYGNKIKEDKDLFND